MTLDSLARALASGRPDAVLPGLSGRVCDDSRLVQPGDLFVAVPGVHVDGHQFISQALERGAAAVVVQRDCPIPAAIPVLRVTDAALALGRLAQAAVGNPSDSLAVLGVTGTNGKTTVTWLTGAILRAAGSACGVIGTTGYDTGQGFEPAPNTTPGAVQLARLLRDARDHGLHALAMECSSHALHQKRTDGIRFAAAAFTNLTGDHLDYHGTPENYLAAKARLFQGLDPSATAILNAQDPASARLARKTRARVLRYGFDTHCDLAADIAREDVRSTRFSLRFIGEDLSIECPLVGRHNVMNCLAAAGLAYAAGAPLDAIATGLANLQQVPGRLERIPDDMGPTVFVDYAHTDDALDQVLQALRPLTLGRLVVVFGCGGDRDRSKRPRMARVAQRLADCIVLTDDNPRTEAPDAIRREIVAGLDAAGRKKTTEIADRRQAIQHALATAARDDVVLIAGKGHEDYQVLADRVLEFDDRRVARECLAQLAAAPRPRTTTACPETHR